MVSTLQSRWMKASFILLSNCLQFTYCNNSVRTDKGRQDNWKGNYYYEMRGINIIKKKSLPQGDVFHEEAATLFIKNSLCMRDHTKLRCIYSNVSHCCFIEKKEGSRVGELLAARSLQCSVFVRKTSASVVCPLGPVAQDFDRKFSVPGRQVFLEYQRHAQGRPVCHL